MKKSSILYFVTVSTILLTSGCASTPKPKPPIPPSVVSSIVKAEAFMDICLNFNYWDSTEYGIVRYVFDANKNRTLASYSVNKSELDNFVSQVLSKTRQNLSEKPPNTSEKKNMELDCKKAAGTFKTTYSQWQEYERNKANKPVIINQPAPQYTLPTYSVPSTTFCSGFGNMRYCSSF